MQAISSPKIYVQFRHWSLTSASITGQMALSYSFSNHFSSDVPLLFKLHQLGQLIIRKMPPDLRGPTSKGRKGMERKGNGKEKAMRGGREPVT